MSLSLLGVCQECGVLYWGTWRILRVPDRRYGSQFYSWHHEWNFSGNISIRSGQEWGVKKGVLGGYWGFLTGDLKDRIILKVLNDVFLSYGRYPESVVLISLLEVHQEWGIKKGCTWRTLIVPYGRNGGQGFTWHDGCTWYTPSIIYWKFCVIIFIFGSNIRMGYDENINVHGPT